MEHERKKNRLDLSLYKKHRGFFLTIGTQNRTTIFLDNKIVEHFVEILKNISEKESWLIHAYCFMPNHVHLLIESMQENQNVIKFISKFKQLTGFWYKQNFGKQLWQKSFYDHVLRKEEDIKNVAKYTLENPQKDMLVTNWRDYPFLGSFVYNVDEL